MRDATKVLQLTEKLPQLPKERRPKYQIELYKLLLQMPRQEEIRVTAAHPAAIA